MALISGNEKAWAAFVIGTVVQSLNIVISYLPADTPNKQLLTIICAIVGTIGQGLGVYQIANTGYVKVGDIKLSPVQSITSAIAELENDYGLKLTQKLPPEMSGEHN